MSFQTWMECVGASTGDATAVANSTTETILLPDFTIPANFMYAGRTLRYTIAGKYSTTGTPTMTFRCRAGGVGGTLLAASAAITTPSGVTNAFWFAELLITCRTAGSTGTWLADGLATVCAAVAPTVASATGAAAVTPMTAGGVTAPATATVDSTASQALSFTLQWSAASSSDTATCQHAELDSKN